MAKNHGASDETSRESGYYKTILTEEADAPEETLFDEETADNWDDALDTDAYAADDGDPVFEETRRRSRKHAFMALGSVLVAAIIFIVGWHSYYNHQLSPVSSSKKKIIVEIPDGSNIADVAKILEERGLIRSRMVFQSYAGRHSRGTKKIKAANYQFTPSMSSVQIFNAMLNGKSYAGALSVTIPEGKTVKDMAEILSDAHICSKDEFIAETKKIGDYKKRYSILSSYPDNASGRTPMEGYLFPDTYQFVSNTSAATVVNKMLANTQAKFDEATLKKIKDSGHSVDEILTMGSLVEMESKLDEDKANVASVFYNRMKAGMKLQSDITVNYALGNKKVVLSNSDLKVNSPYNTYQNAGLPIGPICSPGMKAIKAAIEPADTNHYYFVADIKTGKIHFAKTIDEHQQNIKKYMH